jgi:hypothetical protein
LNYSIPHSILKSGGKTDYEKLTFETRDVEPFQWAPVEDAAKYEVEISANENFSPSQKFDTGTATSFALTQVHFGSYYVRVRSVNAAGEPGVPSEIARLDVLLPAPQVTAPYVAKVDPVPAGQKHHHTFELKWSKLPFAKNYEVQWGSDIDFTQQKKFITTSASRDISVTKPMDYAFRVRALKSDGTPLTAYSKTEIAAFRYRSKGAAKNVSRESAPASVAARPPLTPVREPSAMIPVLTLLKPAKADQVMMPETAGFSLLFNWTPMPNAEGYELQFASDADFVNMIGEAKGKSASLRYTERFPEGRVFWRVRARTKSGYSEWSETSDFNIIEE